MAPPRLYLPDHLAGPRSVSADAGAVRLSADWLVPVGSPPIPHGATLIGAGGRIEAVGAAADVPAPPGTPAMHFAGAAILPGLVNAHTHLELTGLEGQVAESSFPAWIRRIIEVKRGRSPADFLGAARRGLADCHAAGVTTVADTGDSGAAIEALAEAGGSGIAYHEVFGPEPDRAEQALDGLRRRVTELRRFESARVRLGVSPHAPYSVSGRLYAAVSAWARGECLPMAVHLAESPEEAALLASGTGGFAEAWAARGIALPPRDAGTPVEWLERHGVLGDDTLCIHVVHATPADIRRLARAGAAIAHCPRSNRAHAHGTAPLAGFLGAGLRVGCGTDSVVSAAPLDLLAEVRAAREIAGLSAEQALRLCTIDAARAIGFDADVGTLAPGKWGDACVIRLTSPATPSSVVDAILATSPSAVVATLLAGRTVHRA